jgi:hypothetical protein
MSASDKEGCIASGRNIISRSRARLHASGLASSWGGPSVKCFSPEPEVYKLSARSLQIEYRKITRIMSTGSVQ